MPIAREMCSNNSLFYSPGRLTQVQRIPRAKPGEPTASGSQSCMAAATKRTRSKQVAGTEVERPVLWSPYTRDIVPGQKTRCRGWRVEKCLIFLEDLATVTILLNRDSPSLPSASYPRPLAADSPLFR